MNTIKKYTLTIIWMFFITIQVSAQAFSDANNLYAEGNYEEAITAYKALLPINGEQMSADYAYVYNNLGNAYFKQNELAKAILSYERALRLRPNYKDAKYNLAFAQSKIVDNISDTQSFFLSSWAKIVRNQLTETTWTWISISLFTLALIGILLFLLSRVTWLRKTAFHCAWVMMLISLIAGLNAHSLHKRDTLRNEAIITQGIVNAKSSPDQSGTDLFTLHEGTKVEIHETIGEWANIHVGNNVGWIKIGLLERI